MIPLLIEACPTFQSVVDDHRRFYEEELTYSELAEFSRHLLQLYRQHETEAFPAVGQVIERLHIEGDHYVREAATIGILESIQNSWGHENTNPELFVPYLLPESVRWWRSLNDFWSGKSKFVGDGL